MTTQKLEEKGKLRNRDFLNKYMGLEFKKRKIHRLNIDKSLIKSGDSLFIRRYDGVDPMIMWGLGNAIGTLLYLIFLFFNKIQNLYFKKSNINF